MKIARKKAETVNDADIRQHRKLTKKVNKNYIKIACEYTYRPRVAVTE